MNVANAFSHTIVYEGGNIRSTSNTCHTNERYTYGNTNVSNEISMGLLTTRTGSNNYIASSSRRQSRVEHEHPTIPSMQSTDTDPLHVDSMSAESDEDSDTSFTDQEADESLSIAINGGTTEQENRSVAGSVRRRFEDKWDFGEPNRTCPYCGAIMWYEERTIKSKRPLNPKFSLCCQEGIVQLPLLKEAPEFLKVLLDYGNGRRSTKFRENIRAYNSIFAFTSMGGKIDNQINNGSGAYAFRLNGQNHHKIGSLLSIIGQHPKFAQLYIYDTQNEVRNRMNAINGSDGTRNLEPQIVNGILQMLDDCNALAKVFRMARDRFQESDFIPVTIKIIGVRQRDGRQYNLPTASEVAALIIGDGVMPNGHRDVIVEEKGFGRRRINELHPNFMAMQYPLLFPYAEDGYRVGIMHSDAIGRQRKKRTKLSMREYYAFLIQQRLCEGQTLLRGGRLFQQFLVDAYTCIEKQRLSWVRNNQPKLRADLYKGLQDAVVAGDTTPASAGRRFVLPSSFTGGPRYMVQNYQDAMAICRWAGPPDLFLTITCNPKWSEIQKFLNLIPGQKAEDRPDIVVRAFKIKLDQLMKDVRHGRYFGRVMATIYTIEFQKRGLPHAHIVLFLHPDDKQPTVADIDKFISAELPNEKDDPVGYEAVVQFMIHGPCGAPNPRSPCMVDGKCSKHYPKKFHGETTVDQDGFPIYKRRDNNLKAKKNGVEIDNRWVIPHNRDLIVKYDAHINVEWCNQSRSIKYLFKYINKGQDRTTAMIEENVVSDNSSRLQTIKEVDEIKTFLDCRYVSASESCWRILQFDIQFRDPPVERLSFHLPNEQSVVFQDYDDLGNVMRRPDIEKTIFTEWMVANRMHEEAKQLSYVEFPTKWVWNKGKKMWTKRQCGRSIGRIFYAHPSSGERFYLRMLLNVVKGPETFEDIRTVSGIVYPTFKEACNALGLLDDDNEWHVAIQEASQWSTGQRIREMFVTLLLFSEVANPLELWEKNWEVLSDDILHKKRLMLNDPQLQLTDEEVKNYALYELEQILNKNNRTLKEFPTLPFPNISFQGSIHNRLIREELAYDRHSLQNQFPDLYESLNFEQKRVFDDVIHNVEHNLSGLFFVYGNGGTGKTFLWKTILTYLQSKGRIVLAVASSGIAALLLPGGRTAHSRFKIPISVDEDTCCAVSQQSHLAELIRKAALYYMG